MWRQQLLPECEAGKVSIAVLENPVRLIVGVADFDQPVLHLLLHVQAVFPGIRSFGVLIVPTHSLAKIRQWTKRGAGRRKNTALEGIRERVVWSKKVVLRGVQGSRQAETVPPADFITCLCETAGSAANHRVVPKTVCKAYARPELLIIGVRKRAGLPSDSREELRPRNLEGARRHQLSQRLEAHQALPGATGGRRC